MWQLILISHVGKPNLNPEFRRLSLIDGLGKLNEYPIKNQIENEVDNKLSLNQLGFRKGYHTTIQTIHMVVYNHQKQNPKTRRHLTTLDV